jgi:hypothetical protein
MYINVCILYTKVCKKDENVAIMCSMLVYKSTWKFSVAF